MEDKFSFIYKGYKISLSCFKQNSTSKIEVAELIELMDKLNFQYSFSKWFNMDKGELDALGIKIEYKSQTKTLYEYKEDLRKFNQQLQLIEKINGLERNLVNNYILNSDSREKEYWAIKQVCRLYQDIYLTFCNAKFALTSAYNKFHPQSTVLWESGYKGQLFIRTLHANNAIIWYRSLFDLLLQTFWIGKELYLKYYEKCVKEECAKNCKKCKCNKKKYEDYNGKMISNQDYDRILKDCKWNNINDTDKLCFEQFKKNTNFRCIDSWCNSLKHRNGLRYNGLYPEPNIVYNKNFTFLQQNGKISFLQKNGNIERDLELKDVDFVIEELRKYHLHLFKLISDSFEELCGFFKKLGYDIGKHSIL